MAIKPDWKLNIPSALATIAAGAIGAGGALLTVQHKTEAAVGQVVRLELRVDKIEAAREIDRNTMQAIRLEISDMKGDMRVVRQILEGMMRPPPMGSPR